MLKDYVDEKQILKKLAELQEAKEIKENYHEQEKGIDAFFKDYHDGSEGIDEETRNVIDSLYEKGYDNQEIFILAKTILHATEDYIKKAKGQKKAIDNTISEITEEIGQLAMEGAEKAGVTQRQLSFPMFGTVKVSSKKVPTIIDEDIVIQELAKDEELRKLLTIDKKAFNKAKLDGIAGINMEEKLTVKIS